MRGHLPRKLSMTAAALVLGATLLPTGATPAQATPAGSTWNLVFADDFNNSALDTSKWHTCFYWAPTTCTIESNNELELYTPNNVSLANGALKLQARKQSDVGWNGKTYGYTSGMVSTGGSPWSSPAKAPGFTFTYGYVESRVMVPGGKGLWPALWLLPNDHSWPPEIDVMEILGDQPAETHMNYHYTKSDGSHGNVGNAWTGPDFSAGWHTFGVDWQPGSLVWYVDGVERFRFTGTQVTSKASYVLLNLAVGGNWPGSPDASTAFPADYLVDYVRVWQKSGSTAPPALDRTAPKMKMGKPGAGTRVNETAAKIKATASDNVRVTKMRIRIDGVTKATSERGSISYRWKTRSVSRGHHTITFKAFDAAGNVAVKRLTVRR